MHSWPTFTWSHTIRLDGPHIRQGSRRNNPIQRINTTGIFGTVLHLGFNVWKNPKGYTSQKKTSHWLQHVTVTFRLTSPSTHVYRLSLRFTNSYFILILGPRKEVPSKGVLLLRRSALVYHTFYSHTTTHATPFLPWREGNSRPGGRAIWEPGGRVPLSPTTQATMGVPEGGLHLAPVLS
jgi:hypothetical protein